MTIKWPPSQALEAPLGGAKPGEAAGEAEFESWLYRLNARAESFCPNTDRYHAEQPAPAGSGYANVCTRCGHHTIFPF